MKSNKNILWINYLKALCMIGIYYIHCTSYYGYTIPYINSFITPIYVNAFFFVSGYLLFRKQLSAPVINENVSVYFSHGGVILLKNILFRIAIPSTVFAMIEFVPSYMLRGKLITLNEFLIKTLGGNTYWFNSALVVAEILILIMLLSRKKNIWFYFSCSIVIFGIGYYLCSNGIELQHNYWEFNQALLAIIFLALGGVYWKYEAKIDKLINKYVACFLIVAYFGCVILFREKCKVLISTLSVNIPGVFLSLLGTIAFVYILKQIKIKIKLFDFLGQNTIGFYFMSGALPIVLSGVANKFISGNVAGLLVVSALSISIAYILVIIINRFLPFLFDFRTIKDFSLCRKKESE